MGDKSAIQWTDATWNPVTGCRKVSAGCHHCYAEGVADRFWATQYPPNADGSPRRFTDVRVHEDRLEQPLRWTRPRRVFVNSMSDLFHEDVPDEFIGGVFAVMALAPQHTFQILTKRPDRMKRLLLHWLRGVPRSHDPSHGIDLLPPVATELPLPNVWLGVSVENQAAADERVPLLLDTPAAVRFLSCEPLLGPVDLAGPGFLRIDGCHTFPSGEAFPEWCACRGSGSPRIDWLIVGGESGPKARPMDLAWGRSLVAQGRDAGVPVFVKQLGRRPVEPVPGDRFPRQLDLRDSHGGDPDEWPEDLRVREFPTTRGGTASLRTATRAAQFRWS